LGGAIRLRHPAKGYRITSDSVILASLVPLPLGCRGLELGTGYGQVSLCLIARESSLHMTGLELMPQAAELARQNARLNKMSANFEIIEGDVATYGFSPVYDFVVANPPYRLAEGHTASPDPVKAAATVEQVPLLCWARAGSASSEATGCSLFYSGCPALR
jgi:tRNA1(Val) A37 N6-methylase TrmN6